MWRYARRLIQPLFLVLALVFIAVMLGSQWDALRAYPWQLRPLWLVASALAMAGAWTLDVLIWRYILGLVGGRLGFGMATRIWFVSALIRYIPGNVWQPLGMTMLARRYGVRPEATITSIVLFQAANLLAVGLIAALYFPLTHNLGLLQRLTGIHLDTAPVLAIIPIIIFLIRPQWLIQMLNWALSKIGRSPLPVRLNSLELLRVLAFTVLNWLLLSAAFVALTMAFTNFSLGDVPRLALHLGAGYPIAYAVGYLSFVTPSGLAVREGTLFLLLAPVIGGDIVTAAALAMRVWVLIGELVAAGLSLLTWPGGRLSIRLGQGMAAETAPESVTSAPEIHHA